jgi:hypothetical protein
VHVPCEPFAVPVTTADADAAPGAAGTGTGTGLALKEDDVDRADVVSDELACVKGLITVGGW